MKNGAVFFSKWQIAAWPIITPCISIALLHVSCSGPKWTRKFIIHFTPHCFIMKHFYLFSSVSVPVPTRGRVSFRPIALARVALASSKDLDNDKKTKKSKHTVTAHSALCCLKLLCMWSYETQTRGRLHRKLRCTRGKQMTCAWNSSV